MIICIFFLLVSHLSSINQELKSKVQELRLYETVLMQRIHAVKSITNDTATPDVKVYSPILIVSRFYERRPTQSVDVVRIEI